jgi:uncharacterized protein (DUF433 family)
MSEAKTYVWTDEHGEMRVGTSRVLLEGVIYPFLAGQSPESIRRSYPVLDLEEVYGAITYYLAHREEVDSYLARQEAQWDQAEAEQERNPPPALKHLRSFLATRAKDPQGAK